MVGLLRRPDHSRSGASKLMSTSLRSSGTCLISSCRIVSSRSANNNDPLAVRLLATGGPIIFYIAFNQPRMRQRTRRIIHVCVRRVVEQDNRTFLRDCGELAYQIPQAIIEDPAIGRQIDGATRVDVVEEPIAIDSLPVPEYSTVRARGALQPFHGRDGEPRNVDVGTLEYLQSLPDAFDALRLITRRIGHRNTAMRIEGTETLPSVPSSRSHVHDQRVALAVIGKRVSSGALVGYDE